MKNIIILLIGFCLLSSGTFAQSPFSQTASNPTGAITDASVDTVNYTLKRSYSFVSVQPVITRLTGTMAGTSTLYHSVNGTNWVAVGTPLTLTNAAVNTTVWTINSPARYWRVVTGGATTVTGTAAARISVSAP